MRLFRETAEKTVDEPGRRRWEGPRREVIRGNGTMRQVPMLTRYRLFKTPFGGIYVQHWHRPDSDRDCHDHPWWFGSLVLRGGYTEEVRYWPGSVLSYTRNIRRRRLSWHTMPLNQAHRVVAVEPRTWTLLLVGPKRQDRSFYLHNRWQVARDPDWGQVTVTGLPAGWHVYPLVPVDPVRVPWQAYIAQGGNPDPLNC